LHLFIHYWAQGKEENRRAGAGDEYGLLEAQVPAVLFQSFPQEVVDTFAEVTGPAGRVRLPEDINGSLVDSEQRAWLVERIVNSEALMVRKKSFFQYTESAR